jgi:DNA-binding GntR family transcriptional regulator
MNAIEWIVQNHVAATSAPEKAKRTSHRFDRAAEIVALIEQKGAAMTRVEIQDTLGLSKTAVREACNAGADMGLLRQSRSGLLEHCSYTYWVDLA